MDFPWKKKEEINKEIAKLASMENSEPYRIIMDKLRGKLTEQFMMMLKIDTRDKDGIQKIVIQVQSLYNILCMVPNETYDLATALNDIERNERAQTEQALKARGIRIGGSV